RPVTQEEAQALGVPRTRGGASVRKYATALVLGLFLLLGAGSVQADDAPPTVTVVEHYQGKDVLWWAARAVKARREANASRPQLQDLRHAARACPPQAIGSLARALLCIHRFEGSWQDPAAPFWGGLQMDMSFQRRYGGEFLAAWGTADNWPPFVQLTVAMRAVLAGRGFGPWPNTARMCGLL